MNKIITIFCFALLINNAFSQKTGNFPYTRYGMGEILDQNIVPVRSMGGIGNAFIDPYHSSFINPASLSYLAATSYEVGLSSKRSSLSDGTTKSISYNGGIDYLSIAFPLHNPLNDAYENVKRRFRFGMGFKLAKFSNVAYNITSTDTDPNFGSFTRNYAGNGGSYGVQWANSALYKNLSFGLSLGYNFGKSTYGRTVGFNDLEYAFDNIFATNNYIRGFTYNLGAIYSFKLNEAAMEDKTSTFEKRLNIGLRLKSATGFKTTSERMAFDVQGITAATTNIDTIYNDTLSGKGKLPAEFGIGINFVANSKFTLGADFSFAKWSSYYNEANEDEVGDLNDAYGLAIGGTYRPDYKSFTSFWERVTYRYGGYYRQDARIVNEKSINEIGVTLGAGLPFVFQRKVSHVNLGFELGTRGKGTVIQENFFKINLGATFNDDEWFIKRKYN